jgi:hypothetical protein
MCIHDLLCLILSDLGAQFGSVATPCPASVTLSRTNFYGGEFFGVHWITGSIRGSSPRTVMTTQ